MDAVKIGKIDSGKVPQEIIDATEAVVGSLGGEVSSIVAISALQSASMNIAANLDDEGKYYVIEMMVQAIDFITEGVLCDECDKQQECKGEH